MSTPVPCRLHFILARDAPVGVIFRRGPSRWNQIIKWNTDTDTFEPGQWFHGRIYERRCDLSPDGKLLVYFAAKHAQKTPDDFYSWTAISKLPFLTALAIWPQDHSWNGGGLFKTNHSLWLNKLESLIDRSATHGHIAVQNDEVRKGEDDSIEPRRLERDGWVLTKEISVARVTDNVKATFEANIDKVRPSEIEWLRSLVNQLPTTTYGVVTLGSSVLQKSGPHGDGRIVSKTAVISWNSHELFSFRSNETADDIIFDRVTCADWDHRGRVAFVRNGKLFVMNAQSLGEPSVELGDFNNSKPETFQAPAWATEWY